MKIKLLNIMILTSLIVVGCSNNNDDKNTDAERGSDWIIVDETRMNITGTVTGYSDDKMKVFIDTNEEELSFDLARQFIGVEGDVIQLSYNENEGTYQQTIAEGTSYSPGNSAQEINSKKLEIKDNMEELPTNEYYGNDNINDTPNITETGIFYGKSDNHSIEIETVGGMNIFVFPALLGDKLNLFSYEEEVELTYYINEKGQNILLEIN